MSIYVVLLLAVIQGLAELLPVSSSAHVILVQTLLGFDPSRPDMTFLLVMLHTGTMFAVLIYFWSRWKKILSNKVEFLRFSRHVAIATVATGILGFGLKILIEKVFLEHYMGIEKGEIEHLFKMLPLIAGCLFIVGLLIIYAGLKTNKPKASSNNSSLETSKKSLTDLDALWIGLSQGLVLPFRGLSRSGTTISVGLLLGKSRELSEEFSFALALVLTPPVILRSLKRFMETQTADMSLTTMMLPGLLGAVFAFLAGLVALKWLSKWLESGKWYLFGIYCIVFSVVVASVSFLQK
jgi:undecaprenyl-diphosphatase